MTKKELQLVLAFLKARVAGRKPRLWRPGYSKAQFQRLIWTAIQTNKKARALYDQIPD